MNPTPEQQALIEAIVRVLEADADVEAAWLSGSLGRGAGDAFSDVDVTALVVPASRPDAVGRRYVQAVAGIAPPLLVNPLFGARVVSVVTADWARFDLSFLGSDELSRLDGSRLRVLFNKGRQSPTARPRTPYAPSARTVLDLTNEFLRVVGLLVVADGRREWLLALSGTDILRRLTLDLMLEANGVSPEDRGGALKRNPFLTAGQRRALENLPPVAANRESLFEANRELARLFLPLARRLAEETGAAWPAEFEAATRRHLRDRLGLDLP
jgi:predicted nucleotidyltransferase